METLKLPTVIPIQLSSVDNRWVLVEKVSSISLSTSKFVHIFQAGERSLPVESFNFDHYFVHVVIFWLEFAGYSFPKVCLQGQITYRFPKRYHFSKSKKFWEFKFFQNDDDTLRNKSLIITQGKASWVHTNGMIFSLKRIGKPAKKWLSFLFHLLLVLTYTSNLLGDFSRDKLIILDINFCGKSNFI